MCNTCPAKIIVFQLNPFAVSNPAVETPYRPAMAESVSPAMTV
jgi:hypothetical protein